MSVQVERVADGYVVSRRFSNLAAAQRATDLLLEINEDAFLPLSGGWVPPLPEHVTIGDKRVLLNPVSQATGD